MIKRTTKYIASDGTEHDSPQAAAERELVQRIDDLLGPVTSLTSLMRESIAEKLACNPEALRDVVNAYFEDLEAHPDVDISRIGDSFTFDVTKMWHCDGNHMFPVCWDPQCWHKTPAKTDNRICATCDGGPGNDGPCLCGEERWVEPDQSADHREPPHPSGLVLTDKVRSCVAVNNPEASHTVYDWLVQGWTPEQMVEQGMAVRLEDGEIAPGVRGFEMEVPGGMALSSDDIIATGQLFSDAQAVAQGLRHTGHQDAVKRPAQGDPDDPTTWRAELPVDHPSYCRPFGTRED